MLFIYCTTIRKLITFRVLVKFQELPSKDYLKILYVRSYDMNVRHVFLTDRLLPIFLLYLLCVFDKNNIPIFF